MTARNELKIVRPTPSHHLGRSVELAAIAKWQDGPAGVPLVISGQGGIGKTALARTHLFRDEGGLLVDCSEAKNADEMAQAFAIALAIGPEEPRSLPALEERLESRSLRTIVLDGVEGLASEPDALAPFVALAPFAILTSRIRVNLPDASSLTVNALEGPEGSAAAMQILLGRIDLVGREELTSATGSREKLEAILQIADGVPLALELAAKKLSTMGLDWTSARLAHVMLEPKAAGSLDESMRRSWDLLPPDLQSTLAALAIFSRSFDVEAAQRLLLADLLALEEQLERLVEHSLLLVENREGRAFRLPRPVREYARRAFENDGGNRALYLRHAADVVRAAKDLVLLLLGPSRADAFNELEKLRPDLEAIAVKDGAVSVDAKTVFDALDALATIARAGGAPASYLVARSSARATHAFAEADVHTQHAALLTECTVTRMFGAPGDAVMLAERACALPELDEAEQIEGALALSRCLMVVGRHDEAYDRVDEALALAGQGPMECKAATWMAQVARYAGHIRDARHYAMRALELARRASDTESLAQVTLVLAYMHYDAGEFEQTLLLTREGLAANQGLTDRSGVLLGLRADALMMLGRHTEAHAQIALARERAALTNRSAIVAFADVREALLWLTQNDLESAKVSVSHALVLGEDDGSRALALAISAVVDASLGLTVSADEFAKRAYGARDGAHARHIVQIMLIGYELRRWPASDRAAQERIQAALNQVLRPDSFGTAPLSASADVRHVLSLFSRELGLREYSTAPVSERPELTLTSDAGVLKLGRISLDLTRRTAMRRIVFALALAKRQPVTDEELVRAGWPDEEMMPASGRNRVRVAIAFLRKSLLGPLIVRDGSGYSLDCELRFVEGV